MKSVLLLVLLASVSLTTYAQKCKLDYEKKDPFTRQMTAGITATLDKSWLIGFNRIDNSYSAGLLICFAGVKTDAIRQGDTLMIALDNAAPVVLSALANAAPTSNVAGGGYNAQIQTSYSVKYVLTPAQMQQLAQKRPVAVRVYFGNTTFSVEVTPANGQKIMQAAACILK